MTRGHDQLVVCPADGCRLSNFYVKRDTKTGVVTVRCAQCGHVLLTAQSEPPP